MKLFSIEFHAESMDFFALTPFIAADWNSIGIGWLKWAIGFKITRK